MTELPAWYYFRICKIIITIDDLFKVYSVPDIIFGALTYIIKLILYRAIKNGMKLEGAQSTRPHYWKQLKVEP